MTDYGLISQLIRATSLPAFAIKPGTGVIVEANLAAAALFRLPTLLNYDLESLFPTCSGSLRRWVITTQKQGYADGIFPDKDGTRLALTASTLATDPNLLFITGQIAQESVSLVAASVTLPTPLPPLALHPSWQLLPPREQLRHLLEQAVALWHIEGAAILRSTAKGTVAIEQAGSAVAWQEISLTPYAPLERALQRGDSPTHPVGDSHATLAALFVGNGAEIWGAIALVTDTPPSAALPAALASLAALGGAVLAHAHQKHTITAYEQERRHALAQRDHLAQVAHRGVILLNADGDIEVINRRACDFFNWQHDDVLHRPLGNLLGTLGSLGAKIGNALQGNPTTYTELSGRLDRRNMRGRDLDITLEPLDSATGGYWLLISDPALTLGSATTTDETSQYLGRVHQLNVTVHEMRTPLTGMIWQLDMLDDMIQKSALPPDSPIYTTLTTVRQKAEQALGIMDDIKSWVSSGQKPNFEFCDLKLIAEEAIIAVEQSRRGRLHRPIRIRRVFDPIVPLVEGDGRRLHQLLTNLIKNAAESITKDDGEVEVLVRPLRRDTLATYNLSAEKRRLLNNGVEIRVRDNGQGMSKSQQQRIFEPHVSFKLGGSGIGLWVVRTIVEQHQGDIMLESAPSSGTTFTILLPQRVEGSE